MVDNHISGLPVMKDGRLVGMITESDLFRIFRAPGCPRGLRVTISLHEESVCWRR